MKQTLIILSIMLSSAIISKAQSNNNKPEIFSSPGAIDSIINKKGDLLKLEANRPAPTIYIGGQIKPFNYLKTIPAESITKFVYYSDSKKSPYFTMFPDSRPIIAVYTKPKKIEAQKSKEIEERPLFIYPTVKQEVVGEDNTVYVSGDPNLLAASYIGGPAKLEEFIAANLIYPEAAKNNKIQGKVKLSFIVEKDSELSEITPLTKIGYGLEEEAVRIFKKIGRRFNPSILKGRPVRARLTYEVKFELK